MSRDLLKAVVERITSFLIKIARNLCRVCWFVYIPFLVFFLLQYTHITIFSYANHLI